MLRATSLGLRFSTTIQSLPKSPSCHYLQRTQDCASTSSLVFSTTLSRNFAACSSAIHKNPESRPRRHVNAAVSRDVVVTDDMFPRFGQKERQNHPQRHATPNERRQRFVRPLQAPVARGADVEDMLDGAFRPLEGSIVLDHVETNAAVSHTETSGRDPASHALELDIHSHSTNDQQSIVQPKRIQTANTSIRPVPPVLPSSSSRGSLQDLEPPPDFVNVSPLPIPGHADMQSERSRSKLLRTIATTQSVAEAWNAYCTLLHVSQHGNYPPIPFPHLHRLSRLIATSRPRTRTLFLRLLSVLSHLERLGGKVALWEWNSLIDFAGKGWRKTRPADFKVSLDVFNDLVSRNPPGSTFSGQEISLQNGATSKDSRLKPDIVTYTTLLNVASRTLHSPSVRRATSLLKSAGFAPNRLTHLSLLRYFTRTGKISGVRITLAKMKEQNLELGPDGTNAALWAFARNDMVDVASVIYRVLRRNVDPEHVAGEDDAAADKRYLAEVENIDIPDSMGPNQITYTIMIQSLAYHGDLIRSLRVFVDMLSSPNLEDTFDRKAFMDPCSDDLEPPYYTPTLSAFRAIFLGFTRHAQPSKPPKRRDRQLLSHRLVSSLQGRPLRAAWNLDNLIALFESFLALPDTDQPSERIIYWIMMAFVKTSDNDEEILAKVWSQLTTKFGGGWGGRLGRIGKALEEHNLSSTASGAR